MNKVNSSEFDPLQDKTQKNGTEDVKDNSKPSTPQINNEGKAGIKIKYGFVLLIN